MRSPGCVDLLALGLPNRITQVMGNSRIAAPTPTATEPSRDIVACGGRGGIPAIAAMAAEIDYHSPLDGSRDPRY